MTLQLTHLRRLDGSMDLGDPPAPGAVHPPTTMFGRRAMEGAPDAPPRRRWQYHQGFDHQKGPMTSRLCGMSSRCLARGPAPDERLRSCLSRTPGARRRPVNGSRGLNATEMRPPPVRVDMRFTPNPNRRSPPMPNANGTVTGEAFTGVAIPDRRRDFQYHLSDANQGGTSCHALPFGAAGGRLGGHAAEPTAPTRRPCQGTRQNDAQRPEDRHLGNMSKVRSPFEARRSAPSRSQDRLCFVHEASRHPDVCAEFHVTRRSPDIATSSIYFSGRSGRRPEPDVYRAPRQRAPPRESISRRSSASETQQRHRHAS